VKTRSLQVWFISVVVLLAGTLSLSSRAEEPGGREDDKDVNVNLTMTKLWCDHTTEPHEDEPYLVVTGKTSDGKLIASRIPKDGHWDINDGRAPRAVEHQPIWSGLISNGAHADLKIFIMEKDDNPPDDGRRLAAAAARFSGPDSDIEKLLEACIWHRKPTVFNHDFVRDEEGKWRYSAELTVGNSDDVPGVVGVGLSNKEGDLQATWRAVLRGRDQGTPAGQPGTRRFRLDGDGSRYDLYLNLVSTSRLPTVNQPAPGRRYHLQSNATLLCLDVRGKVVQQNADVCQAQPQPEQVWELIPSENHAGFFYIRTCLKPGQDGDFRYLDVFHANRVVGGRVCLASRHAAQVWKLIPAQRPGYFHVQSYISGLFLDVFGASPAIGERVCQAAIAPAQVWGFVDAGKIRD
jgi:hypothetical protein